MIGLMERFLCPVIVGRDREEALLAERVEAARHRRGSLVGLVGEAGIGKSRLARHAASLSEAGGGMVMTGRAPDEPNPTPYRALSEAVLGAWSSSLFALPSTDSVFRPALDVLLHAADPATRRQLAAADASHRLPVVLVADAFLRLVLELADSRPATVILEDLHWADPETLGVVDYIAGRLDRLPILVVATSRPDPKAALSLLRSLDARRAASISDLRRLNAVEIGDMARACLGAASVPTAVTDVLVSRADGIPFVLEEVVAASVASGAIRLVDSEWTATGPIPPIVPFTFAESVHRRMATLDDWVRQVIVAAAVIGHRFDWHLLRAMTELEATVVLDALRIAADAQLIAVDDGADSRSAFRFRHALTREAILGQLLVPERAEVASRALVALEGEYPGLPGPHCEAAARYAEEAGDRHRARELLVECARRAFSQGALASAETALDRARGLATGLDERVAVDRALVEVLSTAGKVERVYHVGAELLEALSARHASRFDRAAARLDLAIAAEAAADWDRGDAHLAEARHVLSEDAPVALAARLDVVEAQIALGRGHDDRAAALATRALALARQHDLQSTGCEALLVAGRLARMTDLRRAERLFTEAEADATAHGLLPLRLRSLQELGTIDLFEGRGPDRLVMARALAESSGALATTALIELHIAVIHLSTLRPEQALEAARRSTELSQTFGLSTLACSLAYQGIAQALACQRRAMEGAFAAATAAEPANASVEAIAWGDGRAMCSLLSEDRSRGLDELDKAVEFGRAAGENGPPYWGIWALLRTLIDRDGAAARAEAAVEKGHHLWLSRAWTGYAEAVARWRSSGGGDGAAAVAATSDAITTGYGRDWARHLAHRLMAEAALEEGWGDPVSWLKEAAAFFTTSGHRRVASACRSLLRVAGVSPATDPTTSGRGQRLGLTRRETEVLDLISEGLSNKEIAARLYLSARTVEKHVERLLLKTDSSSRAQLAVLAVQLASV